MNSIQESLIRIQVELEVGPLDEAQLQEFFGFLKKKKKTYAEMTPKEREEFQVSRIAQMKRRGAVSKALDKKPTFNHMYGGGRVMAHA